MVEMVCVRGPPPFLDASSCSVEGRERSSLSYSPGRCDWMHDRCIRKSRKSRGRASEGEAFFFLHPSESQASQEDKWIAQASGDDSFELLAFPKSSI